MTQTPDHAAPAQRFSASDAAFWAFAEWRRRPGRFNALLLVYLVAGALIVTPWAIAAWRDLGQGFYPFGQAASFRLSGALLSLNSLLLFPLNAFILAALLRLMLPRQPRPSFAHDAFMVLVAQVVVTFLAVIAALLLFLFTAMLMSLATMLISLGMGGPGDAAPPPWVFAAGMILVPLTLLGLVFVPVVHLMLRLSLAPAMTAADGRLRLFQSWPATRGFVLALFGAHLLRFVLVLVIWVIAAAALGLIFLVALAPDIGSTIEAFTALTAPPPAALDVIAVFSVLYWLMTRILEFVALAMGAGIGASFLSARRPARADIQPEGAYAGG